MSCGKRLSFVAGERFLIDRRLSREPGALPSKVMKMQKPHTWNARFSQPFPNGQNDQTFILDPLTFQISQTDNE
jgi:hypothetical protein